jgi:rhodanese-related sulfurtransferase
MSSPSPSAGPSLPAAVSSLTRLRLPDLLHITDRYADQVLSGRFDHLLPDNGLPTAERWFTRLHADDEVDVWLISWVPGHTTELHDHGGSLGALTVLTGALHEYRWSGDSLHRRRLEAGDQAAFPLGWVHDVIGAPALAGPAAPQTLSVHAYSPPLSVMSYYEVTDQRRLRRTRTELTDEPEKSAAPDPSADSGNETPGTETSGGRIDRALERARTRFRRLEATDVPDSLDRGAVLVDIRPAAQRAVEGEAPGALVIERNVLEWRCDPTSAARLPQAVDDDVEWVILCSQGYTSSLAAAALLDLGLHRATDVVGGYQALVAAGVLPEPGSAYCG